MFHDMTTSAQVVETSVTVTDNSPFQDYPHSEDHTTRSNVLSLTTLLFHHYQPVQLRSANTVDEILPRGDIFFLSC